MCGKQLVFYPYQNLKISIVHLPISIPSILSKLLEKHFHSVLNDHLAEYHPLSDIQWDFRG